MRLGQRVAAFTLSVIVVAGVAAADDFGKQFALVGDFPIGPSANRADYESYDTAAHRLYIAAMGAGQLIVFDTADNKVIRRLDGFPKVTGVLVIPELHAVYASVPGGGVMNSLAVGLGMAGLSSGNGKLAIVDTGSLKERARLPAGLFPDGIAWDPKHGRVLVSDELGAAVTVIDAYTEKPAARIETGGEVGNVRYDAAQDRIFAPVQSTNELVAIDPDRARVVARHALPGCQHPHGFIVSPDSEAGYVACDANDRLLTVDLASGRVLANITVAHDPDVLALDVTAHRLYVATEPGTLSIYDIASEKAPVLQANVSIANGAHAVAVDPQTHRLYFDLADLDGRSAVRVLAPRQN